MGKLEYKDLPAFPISEEATDKIEEGVDIYYGLTKREYFAAKAMQGLISNGSQVSQLMGNNSLPVPDYVATEAVKLADALLNALSKEQKEPNN